MKRVIIYDDEKFTIDDYLIKNINPKTKKPIMIETTLIGDIKRSYIPGREDNITLELIIDGMNRKIELDSTTMLKIAKYNNEVELKETIKEINDKKEEINDLNKKINRLEKFIPDLKNIVKDFINSDYEELDDFLTDKYYENMDIDELDMYYE